MARRSRRRKPRVAWLPTFGFDAVVEATADPAPGIFAEIDFPGPGDPVGDAVLYNAFPLTFDATEGAVEVAGVANQISLHDIVTGNEYRLRRIVGKAFIQAYHGTLGSGYSALMDVALGFIICNTDDEGAPTTPFGSVNPLAQDSMEDPWIWRRRWLLNPWNTPIDNTQNQVNNWAATDIPNSNVRYGSVADGPHIDAKTARVIHRSERLFAVLAARRFSPYGNEDPPAPGYSQHGVRMLLDYRLVGNLKGSAIGNRGKTSR